MIKRAAFGTATALAAVSAVATAGPALAIDSPSCSDSGASGYVQLINDPEDDGTFVPLQCFANAGTWNGSVTGVEGITTGVNAVTVTYVDGSGAHTSDYSAGTDTQLGQSAVEVTSVTIH
ncbi:beta/gamma crystallin domain-containing protein [Kineosporia succinea]|uniref:Streptomyces killer toxin-like beta/gamma crystallin domain-containing protein n=1 Tax=Kineosporia succinea TaxID=84632 RepID=A0ABT9P4W6_9ACTN|nr:beta/gamma crystallin domain-containing protein [Kineosporia succinea]MDP9827718.1 hypothetical protein [Kineosporia succinea]